MPVFSFSLRTAQEEPARQVGKHSCGFVIGVRGDVKDARGDAGGINGFDGFGKARAGAGSGRKLRAGSERQECGQEKQNYSAIADQKPSLCLVGIARNRIPVCLFMGCIPENSRYMNAPVTSGSAGAGANGHCLISCVQIRNATTPRATSSRPHFRSGPVCQNNQAQAAMVRTAGTG